jgi:aminoglycoside phosphotransferase (APT) family kinase protein
MARMQVWLHRLPTPGFLSHPKPFLQRRLDDAAEIIRNFDLPGLAAGLDWLDRKRPADPEQACLLHLDFHPVNLMYAGRGRIGVLDWTEADVGDFHADVGTSLMMMQCMPTGETGIYKHFLIKAGRFMLHNRYLRALRRLTPIDYKRLGYYRALALLWRLCTYGRWLRVGPQITGSKPASITYLTLDHLVNMEHFFFRWTGTTVRVG